MQNLLVAAAVLSTAAAGTAEAQRIELAGKVTAKGGPMPHAPLGDANLVALSKFTYEMAEVHIEVLDVAAAKISTIAIKRDALSRLYGRLDPTHVCCESVPLGELVSLRKSRTGLVAGLFLQHTSAPAGWYVEYDTGTRAFGRSVAIGPHPAPGPRTGGWSPGMKASPATDLGQYIEFVGTDGPGAAAWFVVHRPNALPSVTVDLVRVDLATVAATTPIKLAIPPKTARTGYEDRLTFHPAPDFSRFAIVEYDEVGLGTKPAAQVHFVGAKGSFTVPAMSTTYGVAFSRDGAYAYLASSELGTIERVDLAAKKIDATATGSIKLLHNLVLSPKGQLFSLATSDRYAIYDASLATRLDRTHEPDLAPAARELFDGATVTSDGRFVILEQARPAPIAGAIHPARTEFLIARIVD
jgi:hypothetical protein